ncbi:hypothetical protein [Paralysiella testudinis]|uniref:Uncharacterized protein n=1 Tax=Paralysiella testudinis TaxID=2809020 RepID=A0A892ZCI4_9NEIS|nr:hypothetical protein [Paralysiella testudinis]QRQ80731.1 hypothetical protein JQU52_08110 [Paralysiella testudinis]
MYDSEKKGYVSFDPSSGLKRAECAKENNIYLIENTYNVAFKKNKPKIELVSVTKAVLPANRHRTIIGVGESVIISSNIAVVWSVSSPLINISNKSITTITITALDKAGNVTISAKSKYDEKSITLSIIEPTALKFEAVEKIHTESVLDSGFIAKIYILPNHVNFEEVKFSELESYALGTGLLAETTGMPHSQYENGRSEWMTASGYIENKRYGDERRGFGLWRAK